MLLHCMALCCALGPRHMSTDWGQTQQPKPGLVKEAGRWAWTEGGPKMQWPATGLVLRFKGDGIKLSIFDSAPGDPNEKDGNNSNYLWARVNGGAWQTFELKHGANSLEFAGKGPETTLELLKRTESSVGWIQWQSYALAKGGSLLPPPPLRPLLELYGDSNSCGYGVHAPNKETNYAPANSNAMLAFAWLAAEQAGLDLSLNSASGWGIMRGYGGQEEANIPRVFDRLLWEEPEVCAKVPSIVVVVLGDNDFAQGDPGPAYDAAYLAFAKRLRARAPKARMVLCASAAMNDGDPSKKTKSRVGAAIDAIRRELGSQVVRFDFPAYEGDWGFGADWHFSKEGQARLGRTLGDFLTKLKG